MKVKKTGGLWLVNEKTKNRRVNLFQALFEDIQLALDYNSNTNNLFREPKPREESYFDGSHNGIKIEKGTCKYHIKEESDLSIKDLKSLTVPINIDFHILPA